MYEINFWPLITIPGTSEDSIHAEHPELDRFSPWPPHWSEPRRAALTPMSLPCFFLASLCAAFVQDLVAPRSFSESQVLALGCRPLLMWHPHGLQPAGHHTPQASSAPAAMMAQFLEQAVSPPAPCRQSRGRPLPASGLCSDVALLWVQLSRTSASAPQWCSWPSSCSSIFLHRTSHF